MTTVTHQVSEKRIWTAIPNFVDTAVFRPVKDAAERRACRQSLGIPDDAMVLGCVAAIKRDHKRIDVLIDEFARLSNADSGRNWFLAVAGAGQGEETAFLEALARRMVPGRCSFFVNLSRARMPLFYRALDVFCLTSLFEMMPIAVLEALASGLPVLTHDHPVLRWMTGADDAAERCGGVCTDLREAGALATALSASAALPCLAAGARKRAESMFSTTAVIGEYIRLYDAVLAAEESGG